MDLNDLLKGKEIDPKKVLVLRHRPHEPELNKVLPWLAAEKPWKEPALVNVGEDFGMSILQVVC